MAEMAKEWLEYHKAGRSPLFSGFGEDEESFFYKAHIWSGLGGVSKACEEKPGIVCEQVACAKVWSLAVTPTCREMQAV